MTVPPTRPALIATDLPCIHCAYNLRTVGLTSPCPECGRPSEDSLDSLALADPGDLDQVLGGIRLMLAAAVVFPLVFVAMGMLESLLRAGEWTGYVAGSSVCIAGPLLSLFGSLRFCTRIRRFDPARPAPPESQWHGASWPVPIGVAYLVLAASGFACVVANERGILTFVGSDLIAVACFGLAGLLWLIRSALVCRRASWLALHASRPGLSRTLTWFSRFAIGCALTVFIVGGIAFAIAFADEVLHIGIFDVRLNGRRSPPVVAILGVAVLYIALFGWLALNPITLALLFFPISRSRRLAIARAGGPVFQSSGAPSAPPTVPSAPAP